MIRGRLKNAFNAFMGRAPTYYGTYQDYGGRPNRVILSRSNVKTIVGAINNRISVDCASVDIRHVRLNEDGKYLETLDTTLNRVLSKDANLDQTGRGLLLDVVSSLLDEGVVAIVPTWTDVDPVLNESYKIYELRVGKITKWGPQSVSIECYNDQTGRTEEIVQLKRNVAIIENPFYTVMNEPNSTAKRLTRVLNILDAANEKNSGSDLDLIVKLPYPVRNKTKQIEASNRINDIEEQLKSSRHGIAYIDSAEQIIQLNRKVENSLWDMAKDLTEELLAQLGMTMSVLDGTADEQTMMNYTSRIIEPILTAIVEEMERKWITKTAQTQRQAIMYFTNPFRLVPVTKIAEMADSLARNEIITSNEFRSFIGLKPSTDPRADKLLNSNINHPNEEGQTSKSENEIIMDRLDNIDRQIKKGARKNEV